MTFPEYLHRRHYQPSASLTGFDVVEAAGRGDRPTRAEREVVLARRAP